MNLLTLMNEIGEDADLLARNDSWLAMERERKARELEEVAKELRAIDLAQRIKGFLQQRNLVAVQQILRDAGGDVVNIVVKIMNLPDAMSLLQDRTDTLDHLNAAGQMSGWQNDGYDLVTSAALRN